jgi:hypothetical protein
VGTGGAVLNADLIPSEDYEQMHLVQWFRRTYPDVRIFAIPNGGHRHPAVAAKLKATGVSAGVPDLFIPAWKLWIEMKRVKGGTVSAEQKDWIKYLEEVGYCVKVCKGAEDAKKQIQAFVTIENLE